MELSGREKGMVDTAVKKINANLEAFKGLATWYKPKISSGKRIMISTNLVPV